MNKRYNSINAWLAHRFGQKVFKVSLEGECDCPNRDGTAGQGGCIYCHPGSYHPATSPDVGARGKPIRQQLDEGIAYVRRRHRAGRFISYFQSGSNTHAPAEKLAPLFRAALDHPDVVGLAVSTRPDCVGDDHLDLFRELKRAALVWVELGLQSAHDATLDRIGRGHSVACFSDATERLQTAGIPVCAHVILGLPGETRKMMLETAQFLNRARIWGVKIHNLHVLAGTQLEADFRRGAVRIPTREEYAGWVADFLEALDPAIIIHRVSGHSPRRLTIAPDWSVNKLAIFNAVEAELERRDSRQGLKV